MPDVGWNRHGDPSEPVFEARVPPGYSQTSIPAGWPWPQPFDAYPDAMHIATDSALADGYQPYPCFASFDPTDRAAIAHIKRMFYKYPKMWRGVGEVMCRHDDLTNMLVSSEVPRIDHVALDPIFEFCIDGKADVRETRVCAVFVRGFVL